jgi:BirA family biotin operon repressor/biotin-[acetyl-CoA-carboxylase] ligase
VLTFSLAWKLPQSGAQLMGLPLVIGLASETSLAVPVRLKWPNDIWRDGKKMGVSSSSPHRQRVAAHG